MISYGRDPYNHDCTVLQRVASKRMARVMEHCWAVACKTPSPAFIFVDPVVWKWMNTPRAPGHEFMPYG